MTVNEYLFIPPDWKEPVKYRRRWMTTILSSLDNAEQRSMLFTWPRRSLAFTILTKDYYETAYFKQRLSKSLPDVWGVPFWQDETWLTSIASSGQKILNLDTRWRNFDIGGRLVLYQSPISWEVGIIDILSESQITLKNNLQRTWPTGTRVFPILVGRMDRQQIHELVLSSMVRSYIEINEEFDDGIIRRIGELTNHPKYKDFYIFFKMPNWDKIEFKFIHPYEYLRFLGKTFSISHLEETEFSIKANYLCRTKEEIQEYLDFFDHHRGRLNEFWFPSYQQDIKISQPFNASDTQIKVENIAFQSYWLNRVAGSYLKIDFPDRSFVCRKVINFTAPNNIILESSIGKSAGYDELPFITVSFLYLGRFDIDEMEIRYITDSIGEIGLTFNTTFANTERLL